MKFQVTFSNAGPMQERVGEFLARQVPLLGREDLTVTWMEDGEVLMISDASGIDLARTSCPPLSDSSVPIEIETAAIFSWLRSVLEMLRR